MVLLVYGTIYGRKVMLVMYFINSNLMRSRAVKINKMNKVIVPFGVQEKKKRIYLYVMDFCWLL